MRNSRWDRRTFLLTAKLFSKSLFFVSAVKKSKKILGARERAHVNACLTATAQLLKKKTEKAERSGVCASRRPHSVPAARLSSQAYPFEETA